MATYRCAPYNITAGVCHVTSVCMRSRLTLVAMATGGYLPIIRHSWCRFCLVSRTCIQCCCRCSCLCTSHLLSDSCGSAVKRNLLSEKASPSTDIFGTRQNVERGGSPLVVIDPHFVTCLQREWNSGQTLTLTLTLTLLVITDQQIRKLSPFRSAP